MCLFFRKRDLQIKHYLTSQILMSLVIATKQNEMKTDLYLIYE